jgi:L-glutamine:scyllo-inosose aminotransferase
MGTLALTGGTPLRTRKFTKWPVFDDRDRQALLGVFESGKWGGYPSPNTWARTFAEKFAALHDAKYGICAANGTVTLEIALRAAGIRAGDEVIVPSYTWVATAQAAVTVNAVPVFADVDPETYCLDAKSVAAAITPRTKAVIPVHLGCRMADMDALMALAKKHGLVVIEDCAHAHGAKWNGKGAGSIGDLGSFSMQSSKLMTAGEGGMILTSNKTFEEKCQSIVNCARKEDGYNEFDGNVPGGNYRITEWQAALLAVACDRLEEQTALREKNLDYFTARLAEVPGVAPLKRDARLTRVGAYQFILRYDKAAWGGVHRDRVVEALNEEGIPCDGYFYIPLYDSPLFAPFVEHFPALAERYGAGKDWRSAMKTPVAERAAYEESIWLHHPLFMGDAADVDDIVAALKKVYENRHELGRDANDSKDRF